MNKRFRLSPEEIRPIAQGYGACIASDRITVYGQRVGFMYRESPDGPNDSGWRFFSGDESQEYADEPGNFAIYDVNTIANYDESIVPFLSAAAGKAYARGADGKFHEEAIPGEPEAH
mgnify:CR=1 FL=1